MLNTARTTFLEGIVDLYQTELYQDFIDYNKYEISRLLRIFLKHLTGKFLHFMGHIVTHY